MLRTLESKTQAPSRPGTYNKLDRWIGDRLQGSSYFQQLEPRADAKTSMTDDERTRTRLLAKLVRELVTSRSFEHLSDLTDAVKWRCAQLKIRWTNDAINAAYTLVGSNRPIARPPGPPPPRRRVEAAQGPAPIPRAEAKALHDWVLDEWVRRCRRGAA